ncbi:hypothetical protein AVEN_29663-1, partial [Araneus ventricosus]
MSAIFVRNQMYKTSKIKATKHIHDRWGCRNSISLPMGPPTRIPMGLSGHHSYSLDLLPNHRWEWNISLQPGHSTRATIGRLSEHHSLQPGPLESHRWELSG